MPLRKFIPVLALAGLLILPGCSKKKPPVPPPQAQAPTITAPSEPAVVQPVPETKPSQPEAKPADETPSPAPPAPKPKSKPRSTPSARKSEPAADKPAEAAVPARPAPAPRAAAPTPSQPDPTLVTPGLPHDQALHDRMTTDLLLQSTEQNLASLGRGLSSDQQGMVQQVRVYMQQSRGAAQDGDPVRARNLALKAHLLSDELARH